MPENVEDGSGTGEACTTDDGGDLWGDGEPRRTETDGGAEETLGRRDGGDRLGARDPGPTKGLSKREKRRRRRELARRELERIGEGAEEDVPLEEMIDSIQWMLPNIAAVLRENLPRSP
jgi:hypothetical protein